MPKTVKKPYLHFYPSDHASDPGVKELDPLSELVWLRMLFLMSECEDRGRLAVKGKPMSLATVAHECRMPVHQVKACIKTILEKGVASKGTDGVIYSRRMVRDEQYRKKAAKYGTQGLKKAQATAATPATKSKPRTAIKGIEWNGANFLPSTLEVILKDKLAEMVRIKKAVDSIGSHNVSYI